MWLRDKLNDMLGHIIGTGAPHTAAGVGADAAGTAAGAVNAHKDLTAAVHGVAAPDAIESTSGAQDKADAAQVAAVVAGEISVTAAAARGFFMFDAASDIGGVYKVLSRIPSVGAQKTAVVTVDANPKLLGAWATQAGVPGTILLPTHTARARLRLSEAAGGKTATAYVVLYQRTAGGVETAIGTSAESAVLAGGETTYDFSLAVVESAMPLAATDRLVLKAYAIPAGAGADPVVTVYFEGVGLLSSTAGIGVACGWQGGNAAVRYDEIMSGALGGAIAAANPVLSKASRQVRVVAAWSSATAAYQRATAAYGPTLAARMGFSKAELDFASFDYKMRVHGGSGFNNGFCLYTWNGASAQVASSEIVNLGSSLTGLSGVIDPAQIAADAWMIACEIKGDGANNNNLYHCQIVGIPK